MLEGDFEGLSRLLNMGGLVTMSEFFAEIRTPLIFALLCKIYLRLLGMGGLVTLSKIFAEIRTPQIFALLYKSTPSIFTYSVRSWGPCEIRTLPKSRYGLVGKTLTNFILEALFLEDIRNPSAAFRTGGKLFTRWKLGMGVKISYLWWG